MHIVILPKFCQETTGATPADESYQKTQIYSAQSAWLLFEVGKETGV